MCCSKEFYSNIQGSIRHANRLHYRYTHFNEKFTAIEILLFLNCEENISRDLSMSVHCVLKELHDNYQYILAAVVIGYNKSSPLLHYLLPQIFPETISLVIKRQDNYAPLNV